MVAFVAVILSNQLILNMYKTRLIAETSLYQVNLERALLVRNASLFGLDLLYLNLAPPARNQALAGIRQSMLSF
jgi:hypothetical protein